MVDLLQAVNLSRDNITTFLDSIEDEAVRRLLSEHIEDVLNVGSRATTDPATQESRQQFFAAMQGLIDSRLRESP